VYNWRNIKNFDFTKITLCVWNRLYSTKLVKENNLKFAPAKHGEDHLFAIGSTLLANRILYLENPFYHYRQRKNSAVHIASDNNFCIFENLRLLKEFLISKGLYEELETQFSFYMRSALAWSFTYIPLESIERYMKECAKLLNKEDYRKFLKQTEGDFSFTENIFSIKNKTIAGEKIKLVRLLGLSFEIGKGKTLCNH